ncbi:MAG: PH domain-containing protein [Alphaproteobacteria bacterium]|nr:PH domain-containing protein [Alphaproteobacteria bacterium]
MNTPTITWTPLEPGQLKAMRMGAAITAVVVLAVAIGLDLWLVLETPVPAGLIAVPVAVALLYYVSVTPARQFKRWGYAKTEDELHVAHGVLVHTETSVAFHRVQHIDIAQGPIERMCGVWELVLNTAGTLNSSIKLPGLARETAEALRDEIRQRIRAEPE